MTFWQSLEQIKGQDDDMVKYWHQCKFGAYQALTFVRENNFLEQFQIFLKMSYPDVQGTVHDITNYQQKYKFGP